MEKLDKYLISIDGESNEDLGINLISFVKNPAILVKGFAFNKEVKPISFSVDELKMRIIAPALIPMDIYRFDPNDGYEYEVQFTEDNIEKLWSKFKSRLNNTNVFNLEHSSEMVPAYMFQDWIVGKDPKKDKSYSEYGINVPTGSVMVISQITDKEYYDNLVKNEQYAFSIEGLFGLEELKLYASKKKKEDMNQNFDENGPSAYLELPVGIHTIGDKVYTVVEVIENEGLDSEYRRNIIESIVPTSDLNIKNKEQKMEDLKLPDGEHQIGEKIYVIKDGKIVEIKDVLEAEDVKPEDKPVEEEMADEPIVDAPVDTPVATPVAEPAQGGSIDEARLWELVQPKFDEILKMIADINVKISEDEAVDVVAPEEVTMSVSEKFSAVQKFLKKKK